jgi:hypothetical protein
LFLHIGGDVSIPLKNIIAIMDLDSTTLSKDTREFLKISEEEGFVEVVGNDIPKTFILTEYDKKSKVYLSEISSLTLCKRAGFTDGTNYINKQKKS